MPVLPKNQLLDLFESGDLITQSTLKDLIDATYNPILVAGPGITLNTVITPAGTTITINSSGGGGTGTVTSVSTLSSTFIHNTVTNGTTTPVITSALSATGTPSATTYLRGDNTWAPVASATSYTNATPTPLPFPGSSASGYDTIPQGSTFTAQTFTEMMNRMLYPTLYPSLVNPSNGFSLSQAGFQEIGLDTALNFTASFNRGSINPQYTATSPYRSGLPNTYNYTGTGVSNNPSTSLSNTETVASYIVPQGYQTWTGSVSYDIGVQPKDSVGVDFNTPLAAGTTSPNTVWINGVYPPFATTVAIGTLTKQSLQTMTSLIQVSMVAETGGVNQRIDIPIVWSAITGLEQFNTLSNTWDGINLSSFTTPIAPTTVTHTIQGNTVTYNRYTYQGPPIGARQLRFTT
jgi:hypothetical protein